jgi:hypothetical protein
VVEITPLIVKIFRCITDNPPNSMKRKSQTVITPTEAAKRSYAAPALDKGLDILEMLCTSDYALQQSYSSLPISTHRHSAYCLKIATTLKAIRVKGYESSPSVQVRGLPAISFPIVDTTGHAIAALTVPYSERIEKGTHLSIGVNRK